MYIIIKLCHIRNKTGSKDFANSLENIEDVIFTAINTNINPNISTNVMQTSTPKPIILNIKTNISSRIHFNINKAYYLQMHLKEDTEG
jgi:hypothetical protein